MDSLSLREIQLAELEILSFFDTICRKNNLKYSLGGGTLLGAIRHRGFIPWDDDIDVYMSRKEYEKLISYFASHSNEGYSLLYVGNSSLYTNVFAKIVNKKYKIKYLSGDSGQLELEDDSYLWIDIFPLDNEPNIVIVGKIYHRIIKYLHQRRNHFRNLKSLHADRLHNIHRAHRFAMVWNIVCKLFHSENSRFYNLSSFSSSLQYVYPKEWMLDYIEKEFEGNKYYVFREYDKILKQEYGDYMTPPPPDKRNPIHNFIVLKNVLE